MRVLADLNQIVRWRKRNVILRNAINNRYMDNLLLNRINSRQGIVKKKQKTINEISIGCLNYFKILSKIQFWYAPVFSNDT